MGYTCYATNEVVNGESRELVPIKQRKVFYNNYHVYQRGDRIYKQYMGTSEGLETVEERPICAKALASFLEAHSPEIVEEKQVTCEYCTHHISNDAIQRAAETGKIITITDPPVSIDEEDIRKDYDEMYDKEDDND